MMLMTRMVYHHQRNSLNYVRAADLSRCFFRVSTIIGFISIDSSQIVLVMSRDYSLLLLMKPVADISIIVSVIVSEPYEPYGNLLLLVMIFITETGYPSC